ncbi:MAG: hypothetical protein ABJO41_07085 [Erythrobacter sp.]
MRIRYIRDGGNNCRKSARFGAARTDRALNLAARWVRKRNKTKADDGFWSEIAHAQPLAKSDLWRLRPCRIFLHYHMAVLRDNELGIQAFVRKTAGTFSH